MRFLLLSHKQKAGTFALESLSYVTVMLWWRQTARRTMTQCWGTCLCLSEST